MLRIIDLRRQILNKRKLREILPRPKLNIEEALKTVEPIITAVRERGSAAVLDYGEKFDGIRPPQLLVPAAVLEQSLASIAPEVKSALELAISRVKKVSQASLPSSHSVRVAGQAVVSERIVPIERAGVYIPGGRSALASSVIMNVVPAQVAGVSEIVVATPGQREFGGYPHPVVLAVCQMLGINQVLVASGAQAIALLAYGDFELEEPIEPVDVITGPGNIYVAAAKRAVNGVVGIDAEAGPTEIAIIADASANARFVAADLISQAEHDPLAACLLITDSLELAAQVQTQIQLQLLETKHQARVQAALSAEQSAIVIVSNQTQMIEVANAYAAEHLEIHTANAKDISKKITNAGAIFIGPYSPVSLGDYVAGSNHVLPTAGTARFNAGLSVHNFIKPVAEIDYDLSALENSRIAVEILAEVEDLPAHARAVSIRFE